MVKKITKQMAVNIPATPNFIIVNTYPVSISEFSDKELHEIGKQWTIELIKRAAVIRQNK